MQTPTTRGLEVARYCKALARARGDAMGAAAFARNRGWERTSEILERAATAPLDRETSGAAVVSFLDDLAGVLRGGTILGRMTQVRRVPFATRLIRGDEGSTAGFVSEGLPAPVSTIELSEAPAMTAHRCVGLSVVSSEVLFGGVGSDALLAQDVTGAVRRALDLALVDPGNAGSPGPASLTNGATSFDSDATLAGIDEAVRRCLASLTDAGCDLSTAVWVASPRLCGYLATVRGSGDVLPALPGVTAFGGSLVGLPIISSPAATVSGSPTAELLALVEQAQVSVAMDDPALEMSTAAALQLDDSPTAGAQTMISLFQNGLVGFRATAFADWSARPGAVAYARISGVPQ